MNAQTLLDNFSSLADTSNGLAHVRWLISELAIKGKLVNQAASEGSAAELTAHLIQHRQQTLEGLRVAVRKLDELDKSSAPYEIPATWSWVPLSLVAFPQAGFAFASSHFNTAGRGMPLIRIRDISSDSTQCHYSGTYRDEFVVKRGDWLIGMDGQFNVRKWRGDSALLNQRVTRLIFLDERISQGYITLCLQRHLYSLMGTKAYTTVDHLSTKQISEAWIALPPLGEQERIVAKFDELMSMCDQLEAAKAERDALRTAARKSAIDAVSTASTPDELSAAWARIRDNWATYADTPESISSLRSLILDLAVQGRLTQSNVDNWVSATLGEAASYVQRGKSPKYAPNSAVPVVSQKCVKWSGFDIQEARFIDTSTIDSYQPERFLINGDLLWNSTGTGTVGRTALFIESHEYEQVVADSHVTVVRVPDVDPRFLWMWSASPQIQTQVLSSTTGSTNQQELNLSTIKALVIHIPPPEEQQMIVRHVDLLMALCDQLESELSTRNDLAKWWAASVVHHLGDAA